MSRRVATASVWQWLLTSFLVCPRVQLSVAIWKYVDTGLSVNPYINLYTSIKSALLRLSSKDHSFRAFSRASYVVTFSSGRSFVPRRSGFYCFYTLGTIHPRVLTNIIIIITTVCATYKLRHLAVWQPTIILVVCNSPITIVAIVALFVCNTLMGGTC